MKFARAIKYVDVKSTSKYGGWVKKKVGYKGSVHIFRAHRNFYSRYREMSYCDSINISRQTWQRWHMKGKANPYLKLPEEDAALLILTGTNWPPPDWLLTGVPCKKCFTKAKITNTPPQPHCTSCECFGYRRKDV